MTQYDVVTQVGPLVLRLAVGAVFVAHGAQKLFGLWGGGGPTGTAAFFAQLGLTPAYPLALFVGIVELVGGLMLMGGAFTLITAAVLTVNMLVAVWTVHLASGFFLNWTMRARAGSWLRVQPRADRGARLADVHRTGSALDRSVSRAGGRNRRPGSRQAQDWEGLIVRMTLTDKTALITGGKRIGAVVARELAARGMDVALSYQRSREEAEATAETVRAAGRRAVVLQANLSRGEECARSSTAPRRRSAGWTSSSIWRRSIATHRFDEIDEARWNEGLDVDLKAAYLCARAAVPHMRAAGGGRIINFSDWVAASGRPRYTGYLAVFRRQARDHRPDRSPRPRARRRSDSRQRDCARADPGAAEHQR